MRRPGSRTSGVIIFAARNDPHALAVAAELESHFSSKAYIVDSADYPIRWHLTHKLGGRLREPCWSVRGEDWEIPCDAVAGIWWRRPNAHRVPAEIAGAKVRRFCQDEARAAFQGWIHTLGMRVINAPSAEFAATRKPFQLMCARSAGLVTPETLITNDPKEARHFARAYRRPLIFKILTGTSWQFTETRTLLRTHVSKMDNLRYAPVIFQQRVEAKLDIRATIIDGQVFAASIKANHRGAQHDWRLDLAAEIRPHDLPKVIITKLARLMRHLGLRYGAVDLRLTPAGEYVFLEVNPGGQYLFCEIHAGLPITRALASALLNHRHVKFDRGARHRPGAASFRASTQFRS